MTSKQVKRILAGLAGTVDRAVGRLQLRGLQTITAANPVDTGWSRAHWTPSVGAPVPTGQDRPIVIDVARSQAATVLAGNLQKAVEIDRNYKASMGPAYIVNAVRYIIPLNSGSSAQAPSNFVEIALRVAVDATRAELSRGK